MAEEENYLHFHWADYLVGAVSLSISVIIGVFAYFFGKKHNTKEDFVMGSSNMNPFLVGLSIVASGMNGVFLIGVPAEIHYGGTIYSLMGIGIFLSCLIAAHVFVPLFRKTPDSSAYAYLEKRFYSLIPRLLASTVFSISIIFFLSVLLYAPALAFEQVTGLSIHVTQTVCGLVCAAYVCLGGLRAVIWTDAFQMIVIVIGTLVIAILGASEVGGAAKVWNIAEATNRINFDITSADPRTRHTIWTQMIGNTFVWLALLVGNQMIIQRYKSVSSSQKAQIALYTAAGVAWLVLALTVVSGLVMSAYYKDADPYVCGKVKKLDQVFPRFLMLVIGKFHGLPGLYTAAVLAAALSSVSTAVNSLSAVILEDFIEPCVQSLLHQKITPEKQLMISRGLSLFFGLLTIALSYLAPAMGDKVIEIPVKIWGAVGAPLAGVFVLAMFFPCANAVGAVCGLVTSLILGFWLLIGGVLCGQAAVPIQPLGTQCSAEQTNFTQAEHTTPRSDQDFAYVTTAILDEKLHTEDEQNCSLQDFYDISYTWYSLINMIACVTSGIIVSLFSNYWKTGKIFPSLIHNDLMYDFKKCHCPIECLQFWTESSKEEPENINMIESFSRAYRRQHPARQLPQNTTKTSLQGLHNPSFILDQFQQT